MPSINWHYPFKRPCITFLTRSNLNPKFCLWSKLLNSRLDLWACHSSLSFSKEPLSLSCLFFPKKHYFRLVTKQSTSYLAKLTLLPTKLIIIPTPSFTTKVSHRLFLHDNFYHNYTYLHLLPTKWSHWWKQPYGCLVVPFRPWRWSDHH